MSFVTSFVLDLLLVGIHGDQHSVQSIIYKLVCAMVLLYFLKYEFTQALREGLAKYFGSGWNYIDLTLSIAYTMTSIIQVSFPKNDTIYVAV
jgi:hypothetical protein